ncbi:MAG: hypothetical protein ACRYG8_43005 [Janthinobacterium lividum]
MKNRKVPALSARLRMRSRASLACAALAVSLLAHWPARAEVPPMSDSALEAAADLVVTGVVTALSEKDETSYPARGQKLVTAHYTVTLQVEAVEKGRQFAPAETLRFTAERNVTVPRSWLGGTNTLRLTLLPGDEVKAYLLQQSGEWRLFHHQGLWVRR